MLAVFCLHLTVGADEPIPSLDAQLLDDLDSELLDDLKQLPPLRKEKKQPSGVSAPNSTEEIPAEQGGDAQPDAGKPDQVDVGEDVELGKPTDPLTRIGQRMQTAKDLISARNTSTPTQHLQEEILDDLSALIAKLQSQQKQLSRNDPSDDQGGQFRPGAGDGAADGQMEQGPEKSTDRLGQSDTTLTALQRRQELLLRMNWGSLPDRMRDEVRSARVEQFLPKYARLIEQYYKRLAEEPQFQP